MINLFINYYVDKNPSRQVELDFCLQKNLENKLLNVVILENQERLKYSDYFKVINKYSTLDDINIIANSDIFFDSSISQILDLGRNHVLALSRWDWFANGTSQHFNRRDSQDCWMFRGLIDNVQGDFYLGYRGCDNRIAYEFVKAGFRISNPSLLIKSYHVHNTGVRNYEYNSLYLIPGPYEFVVPSNSF